MITPHLDDNGEYGRTAWNGVSVPAMWSMLAAHDPARSATHETGWTMAAELLDDQYQRMLEYRILFVRTWPPGSSPAAARFLAVMDAMLAALDDARTAAVRNGPAISHISASLAEARIALRPVYEQWVSVHGGQGVPAPSGTAVPSPSPGPPPPNQVSARLQAQAADIMYTAGTRVLEGRDALVVPQPYKPSYNIDTSTTFLPSDRTGTVDRLHPEGAAPQTPQTPQAPKNQTRGHTPNGDSTAPVLSSMSQTGKQVSIAQSAPLPSPQRPTERTPGGIIPITPIIGTTTEPPRGLQKLPGLRPTANNRLGFEPSAIAADTTDAGATRSSASVGRAFPEPSIIGGGVLPAGNSSSRRRLANRWNAEDYWPVPQGVPSVIEPPDEPREHSPGPAIGLSE